MERRLFVLAACAFIVAAVLGSAWITGQFTTPAVDRTDGYVSELAARDQPWTRLFRISDGLSGLACALGVALVPRVAREWAGWLALAVYGLLTFVAGLFPLDCATLSDPLCGRQGTSFGHLVHLLAGVLGTGAVLAAMALLSTRWRSWVSWLFTWLTLAATLLTVAALADRHGVGLAHRAQLTMIAIWLVYVALRLLIADDDASGEPRFAPGRLGGAPVLPGTGYGLGLLGGVGILPEGRAGIFPEGGLGRTDAPPEIGVLPETGYGRAEAPPETGHGPGGAIAESGFGRAEIPPEAGCGRAGAFHEAGCGSPHVVVQGSGPVVLITAGPGGAWFHWDAVAGRLAGSRRVIRFDRPGLGLSPHSPDPPTLYGEVARLAALSPAHPEQVTLVAHGVACWHAEAFALTHPLCLARLVLVDPVCAGHRRPLQIARAAGTWLPALGGTWGATVLARLAGPAAHRLLTGLPDLSGVYTMGKVPAAAAGEWLARRDMAADLHRLRAEKPFPDVPVTVISADDRDGCPERLADDLGAEHVRLPGTGRRLPLRDPQAIADAISVGPPCPNT
ncbi:alpha/beta fold hydrolase [Nonomuraea insulae]|uniref:Alpha/beta fold hydrolase n=1 Tax=Nonomuraea insulae TaxID=1616787 RepID=A0ABW1D6X5_9ACTN